MPEDGPDGELYALLHLSPEATDEEIRRAYRQWAQVYHPDKHKTPQMQGIATESFQKIREAYEILSDEKKRKIYDLYGMEGINSGMELGPKLNTLDEVLKGLEKLKQQRQEQVMKERMHHSGSLVFDIALAEKRLMLRGMTSTTEVQTHLSKKNVLALGGNIVLREQLGGGALSAVLRHQISADSNVEAVVMVGLRSLISIQTSRRLSSRSTGGIGFSLSLRDGSMNLTNIWTRQLSETTEGNIHLMIGTNPALSTGLRRQTQRNLSSGELKVGMGTYSLMAQYGHEFSSHSRGQITGRIGSNAVEVEIGGERTISHHSALAMSCTISIHGISYKFSFSRGGQKFVVPILLTPVVTPVIATGALMLPASAYFLLKTYLLKPYFSRRKQKKQREQRRLSAAQVREAIGKAIKAQLLIKTVADRKRDKEMKSGGLVIIQGIYGSVHDLETKSYELGKQPEEEDDIPPSTLDVTTTLNFLVEDGYLQLHDGVKKSGLVGFCDPCPGEKKQLKVVYTHRSQKFEVVAGDYEALKIPDATHKKIY